MGWSHLVGDEHALGARRIATAKAGGLAVLGGKCLPFRNARALRCYEME